MRDLWLTWWDANGRVNTTFQRIPDDATQEDVDIFISTLGVNSSAQTAEARVQSFWTPESPAASAGAYGALDVAVLRFACGEAGHVDVKVPAPVAECFLEDTTTVNGAQEDVAAIITWALAIPLLSPSGAPATSFRTGWRADSPA